MMAHVCIQFLDVQINSQNYNALATVDDGSCLYSVSGCTDSTANNYNPLATVDDGSCQYGVVCNTSVSATGVDESCLA